MKEFGIYVHIPFCNSKCKYCDFNSYAGKGDLQDSYIVALQNEMKSYKEMLKDEVVTTIYIGGGTPSTLMNGGIATIMSCIKQNFNVHEKAEISIEANPNTITYEKVLEWKNAKVNRVSVGLQSSRGNILRLIGRTHTKTDYINSIKILKNVGFKNINTDIMIGLPSQKQSDVKGTLNLVTKLGVSHISAYTLILEDGTPLTEMVKEGKVKVPKELKVVSMYNFVKKYLSKSGYNRYEVSNFARIGYECKHNYNCWTMCEYIGFGAGAHSYYAGTRFSNFEPIEKYISCIKSTGKAIETHDKLTNEEKFEEHIMLGLRTTKGIDLKEIKKKYNVDLAVLKGNEIQKLADLDLIKRNENRIYVTDNGFNVLNTIVLELVY